MAKRVALIHDWLTGMRGGEKVLEILCRIFPAADIFTLVHIPGKVSPLIESHRIRTSVLQQCPAVGKTYRHLLPLMPWAIERFDFRGYDLLISSSHCVAKGAKPPPGVPHFCYCHTPMRYIWDQYDEYFGPGRTSFWVRKIMALARSHLQRWDLRSNARVTKFIANSKNVQERIERLYDRDARVIYPPVNTAFFSAGSGTDQSASEDYFLIVSALAPYKRIDLAIEAFNRCKQKLVVVGEGQDQRKLRSLAGPTIQFQGWQNDTGLRSYYRRAKAVIFPGVEDFGIVPVEAMAAGCPVIAYAKGGALETVKAPETGIFFDEQTPQALVDAIHRLDKVRFDRRAIQRHANLFSEQVCESAFREVFAEWLGEMA